MKRPWARFAEKAVDLVLPPRCPVSGDPVEEQGMLAPAVWKDMPFIVSPFCACCGLPFDLSLEWGGDTVCASCLDDPPPFRKGRSALRYEGAGRDLVLAFKHGDKTHAARCFVPWLVRAGAEFLNDADALVPVPLHPWRLLRRRYNQSCIMARYLGDAIAKPVLADALRRVRSTVSQGHMNSRQRLDNVKGAFAVPETRRRTIAGAHLVLIDDVWTTGATLHACTAALLKAGARRVDALTLTRAVHAH